MMQDTVPAIFVIDDEDSMCQMLTVILENEGYRVETSTDPHQALQRILADDFDLVIQDMKMPSMNGIELLREIKKGKPEMLSIIMTAYSSWDVAVEAMRLGAYDYIRKPFDNDLIRSTVAKAIEQKRVYQNYGEHGGQFEPVRMIGASPQIKHISDLIRRVAQTDTTILVTGESGTGKELVARSMHSSSLRAHEPFIGLNCGAFTESLLESEIFGHKRGAFTGAVADKKGLLQLAERGTLFLDEIGEMTMATQVKFLKFLEDRQFYPVGSTEEVRVDVRIIAATNRVMETEIRAGNIREDLYYRLNVIPIQLPTLRERKEDIPLLAGHFLAEYSEKIGRPAKRFSDHAIQQLLQCDWPGNIRELENVIQRAVVMSVSEVIDEVHCNSESILSENDGLRKITDIIKRTSIPESGIKLEEVLGELEKEYIMEALKSTDNHMTNAAKLLGLSFRSFRYKLKKYGISVI